MPLFLVDIRQGRFIMILWFFWLNVNVCSFTIKSLSVRGRCPDLFESLAELFISIFSFHHITVRSKISFGHYKSHHSGWIMDERWFLITSSFIFNPTLYQYAEVSCSDNGDKKWHRLSQHYEYRIRLTSGDYLASRPVQIPASQLI